jgi:putative intracellular protease/amidase
MTITSNGSKVLIVVTSHSVLGDTGRSTGFYFDEMATPYWALRDAGYAVEIASIRRGIAPWDAASYGENGKRIASVQRFIDDEPSIAQLKATEAVAALDPGAAPNSTGHVAQP